MSRSIPGASTLQAAKQYKAYLKVTHQDELLRFEPFGTPSADGTTTALPLTGAIVADGTAYLAGWYGTGLSHQAFDPTNGSAWTIRYGTPISGASLCLRGSFDPFGAFWYSKATLDNTQPRLYQTFSGSTYEICTIPFTVVSSLSPLIKCKRIEAVCYTNNGIIVACGTHRWRNDGNTAEYQYCTIEFYLISSNGASIQHLNTIIQVPNLSASESTNYWDHNPVLSFVHAIDVDDAILIVAQANDMALQFTISNGVESELVPVMQVDEFGGTTTFHATSLTRRNELYYLTGQHVRTMSDGSTITLECYLTSSDGWNWSVGERNFVLTDIACYPVFLRDHLPSPYTYHAKPYIYAVGHGHVYRAPSRPLDGYGDETDITQDILTWRMDSAANNADSHQLELANEDGRYDDLPETTVFTVKAGFLDDHDDPVSTQIGRAMVDSAETQTDCSGKASFTVPCLDVGQGRLSGWHSPVDIDRWSSVVHRDALTKLDKLVVKTPLIDMKNDQTGLHHYGLNAPLIGYATCQTGINGISRLRFCFSSKADNHCLPYAGILFGGTNDARFNAIVFPRTTSDAPWNKTGAELRISALPEHDASDPTVGGFSLDKDLAPALVARIYESITTWSGGTQTDKSTGKLITTSGGSGLTASFEDDIVYDCVARMVGRKVYVYRKVVDYSPANCADNAGYEELGSYTLSDTLVRKLGKDREYVGVIAGTDVFAMSKCPPGLSYDGIESVLTYAKDPADTSAWEWGSAYSHNADDNAIQVMGGSYGIPLYGRGLFISEDNTRVTVRDVVRSDGTGHDIFSQAGWDALNPKTNPNQWRFLFEPGVIACRVRSGETLFEYNHDALHDLFGVPPLGILRIGDEYIKYWQLPGMYRQNSLGAYIDQDYAGNLIATMHPHEGTEYDLDMLLVHSRWSIPALGTDLSTLTCWEYGGAKPGDNFGIMGESADHNCIDDPSYTKGMQLLVKSRSLIADLSTDPIYITDQAVSTGDGGSAYISRPITVRSRLDGSGNPTNQSSIVAHITGRGYYQSLQSTHDASETLVYYPCYAPVDDEGAIRDEAPLDDIVNVQRFDHTCGLFNSTEDHLRYLAALTGVHNPVFCSLYQATQSIGTSPVSLLDTDGNDLSLSNFTLDLDATIPSDGSWLGVSFRRQDSGPAYTLHIWRAAPAQLCLILEAPNSAIESALKFIEAAYPKLGELTMSATPHLRIVVRDARIQIECEKQLAWAFDLDATTYLDEQGVTQNWRMDTAGKIELFYSISSHSVTSRVLELGDEVENQVVDSDMTGGQAISEVVNDRHILMRSTPGGSIEFGRFTHRDNAGNLLVGLADSTGSSLIGVAGHMQIAGAEYGEYLDMDLIRQRGYLFRGGNNYLAMTVKDSVADARYLIRQAKEYAQQRTYDGIGLPQAQPEDMLTDSDLGEDYVVTSIAFVANAEDATLESHAELRKYELLSPGGM